MLHARKIISPGISQRQEGRSSFIRQAYSHSRVSLQLVWIETPTNPTMKVVDIRACSDIVHEHNKDIVVVVDNTFMSAYFQVCVDVSLCFLKLWLCECIFPPLLNPFFSPMHQQRPLALGADICMYSATKYMNGNAIRHFALTCKFHLQVRMLESVALMLSF